MNIYDKLHANGILFSQKDVAYLVDRYNIKELSIFGSSIRNDFDIHSDIDFLIEFNNSENIISIYKIRNIFLRKEYSICM